MVEHNADASLSATALLPLAQGPNNYDDIKCGLFAYEADGTGVVYTRSGYGSGVTPVELTNDEIRTLNSFEYELLYKPLLVDNEVFTYRFVFPELRDVLYINAIHEGERSTSGYTVETSTDTTSGSDGTWTTIATGIERYLNPYGNYEKLRENPIPVSNVTGIRAIRFTIASTYGWMFGDHGGYKHKIHVWGNKSQTASRLALWHPTNDVPLEARYLDWGTMQVGTSDITFRVKNLSATRRATSNTLFFDSTGDSWGTVFKDTHALKYDTGSFGATCSVPTLQSGEISSVITMRRDMPGSLVGRPYTLRLRSSSVWQEYIHNTTASFGTVAYVEADRSVTVMASSLLEASAYFSDGTKFRNSGAFRDAKTFRGGNVTMGWAGQAPLTEMAGADFYYDDYRDTYQTNTLFVSATLTNVTHSATVSLSAQAVGDNYPEQYADTYGNSGLYAVATVT